MLKPISKIYKNIFSYFRRDRKFILLALFMIAVFIFFCAVRSEADISQYLTVLETERPLYKNDFSFIFFENLKTSLATVLLGTVPCFMGAAFQLYLVTDMLASAFRYFLASVPSGTLIAGTLPHGIFEIPAILLSFLLSVIISKEITLCLLSTLSKESFDNTDSFLFRQGFKETAIFVAESLVFVVIPLIFIGAFVESFVTGWIIEKII